MITMTTISITAAGLGLKIDTSQAIGMFFYLFI